MRHPLLLPALAAALLAGIVLSPAALRAQEGPASAGAPPASGTSAGGPAPGEAPVSGPRALVLEPGPLFQAAIQPPGSTLVHDFVIENTGDEPLLIHSVVPGCTCTVNSYDNFIAPGMTGKVSVSLDLYREWAGMDYFKVVTVISNDAENPRFRLALKGKVGRPPAAAPAPGADPPPVPGGAPGEVG